MASTSSSSPLSRNLAFGLAGVIGLHQCLFPMDHLRTFFLTPTFAVKDDKDLGFRAAVEVMRWLGLANIACTVIIKLLTEDVKPNSNVFTAAVGGLCLFDAIFVKRYFYDASEVVNPKIPTVVGPSLAVFGTGLLAYAARNSMQ